MSLVFADNRYDDGPLPRYGLITLFTQHADRPCRSINNDTRRLYAPGSIRGEIDITNCGKNKLRFAVIVVYILCVYYRHNIAGIIILHKQIIIHRFIIILYILKYISIHNIGISKKQNYYIYL